MRSKTCEICGDVVTSSIEADCGHVTHLCETCKRECPGALELCGRCENGPPDDAWFRQQERKQMGITS